MVSENNTLKKTKVNDSNDSNSTGFSVGEAVNDLDFTMTHKERKKKTKPSTLGQKKTHRKKKASKIKLTEKEAVIFEKYEELVLKLKKLFREGTGNSKLKKSVKRTLKALAKESDKDSTTRNIIEKSGIMHILEVYMKNDSDKNDADVVKWVKGVYTLLKEKKV